MNYRRRLSRLLHRDNYRCGIHIGGCRMQIPNRARASLDHIFTRSFFRDREESVSAADYNKDWNTQPMHQHCNRKRGGQIYGFPLFTCTCHWLRIDESSGGYVLTLCYRIDEDIFEFTVSTENHNFVSRDLSTGKYSAHFGGISEVGISSIWSMGRPKPGKKGITGKGQMGHAFPRISPEEVQEFNRLEKRRTEGSYTETINKFNERMNPMNIQVYFEVVENHIDSDPSP